LQWKMLIYFMDTWSILRSFVTNILLTFGKVRGNLVYFSPFWYVFVPRKIWQPWSDEFSFLLSKFGRSVIWASTLERSAGSFRSS
jgi:hypothetical protein